MSVIGPRLGHAPPAARRIKSRVFSECAKGRRHDLHDCIYTGGARALSEHRRSTAQFVGP